MGSEGAQKELHARHHSQDVISPQAWLVAITLAATVLLMCAAILPAWRTVRAPFLGLFTEPTLVVNGAGDPTWPGYAAGLRYTDHLLAVDGRPLESTTALMRLLSRYKPGDVVTVTARDRDGAQRDVAVRLESIPSQAVLSFFVLPYVLGLAYLGIGTWVFLSRLHAPGGQVFGMLCAVVALDLGLLFDLYTAHWFPRVWVTALSLSGSVAIHLALVFPQRVRFLDRAPALRYLAYVPGVLIVVLNQFAILDFDTPRAYFDTWLVAFIFASMSVLILLAMMVHRLRRSKSPIVQAQARTILWGSLLAFGPIAAWFVVFRVVEWALPAALILPWLALFPLSVAYAILRYRLFDINLVVSRGAVYAFLSITLVGAYFFVLHLVRLVFGVSLQQVNHPLVLGVFVLLLVFLANPARAHLDRVLDRALLGRVVDHRELVSRFVNRLTETTKLDSVLEVVRETLEAGWQLECAALFLYDPRRGCYEPRAIGSTELPDVAFSQDGPLADQMLRRRESIYLYRDRPLPPHLSAEREALDPLRPALFVPVPGHGWLTLGPHHNGTPFYSDDLTVLESLGSQVAVALEKVRLFSDLERRMTEADVLYWVGQAVNFTMGVDDLLELIYAQTGRVLDTSNFYIALRNPEKDTLSFAFYVEQGERLYRNDEWSVDVGLTGEITRTDRPIVTGDYIEECLRRGVEPGGRPGKAWMGVPINAGDQVLGVMTVSSFDPDVTYSPDQLTFFSAIADQAAAILDKARLYREMEQYAQQLAALNEVGSVITSTLDLQTVLHLIMDTAVELIQAEAGSLLLVDQDTDALVFEVTAGPGSADLVGTRLPPGTGVVGAVVQEGQPTIIRDAHSDERWYGGVDDRTGFITHSVIAVPMVSRRHTIGVIQLLNRRDGVPFDQDDERLLTAFATNAAVSIENARLFTQTDQALAARVEELSMMQRIDRELNATLEYRRVMGLTLEWALRMTGSDVGLVAAVVDTEDGARGLRFLANQGYPEDAVAAYEEQLWPLDQGIIGRVVRTGKSALVEDVSSDPDYVPAVPDVVAQLTVPIRCEDQIVGVIAVESLQPDRLDREAREFVARLADHAAISIENARLFEQVRRANEAKTEFVSFVSHELKQPMTSIKGYTDLLVKGAAGDLNESQYRFLETVQSNVSRMNTLVSDLLDISRIESGRLRLESGDVSIEWVIRDVLQAIRGQIEAKQQALEVDVLPGLPPVRGDRDRLVQILTNLVSNAHKYTPSGGHITVRAEGWSDGKERAESPGFVLCSVTDTGIGIASEDQKRLFTKYFRADDPTVRSVAGTGLGLVITKSLVELHGGEIWVESEPGEGSTFSFAIPATQGEHRHWITGAS